MRTCQNRWTLWVVFPFLLSSCALLLNSGPVKILYQSGAEIEIECPSDRIKVECLLEGNDNREFLLVRYLNNQNEVEDLMYTRLRYPGECPGDKKSLEKILQTGKTIYIAGRDYMYDVPEKKLVEFSGLGSFKQSGVVYVFLVMKNENGNCLGQYSECPVKGEDYFIEK